MNSAHSANHPIPAADALGLNLSLPRSRRDVLRAGFFSAAGLLLANQRLFAAVAGNSPAPAPSLSGKIKAKSVIQIFLWGGMSHNDTWDPSPTPATNTTAP